MGSPHNLSASCRKSSGVSYRLSKPISEMYLFDGNISRTPSRTAPRLPSGFEALLCGKGLAVSPFGLRLGDSCSYRSVVLRPGGAEGRQGGLRAPGSNPALPRTSSSGFWAGSRPCPCPRFLIICEMEARNPSSQGGCEIQQDSEGHLANAGHKVGGYTTFLSAHPMPLSSRTRARSLLRC